MTKNALLGFVLALALAPSATTFAQQQQHQHDEECGGRLDLEMVDEEGAVNNIRERVAREPIVQVSDEGGVLWRFVTWLLGGR